MVSLETAEKALKSVYLGVVQNQLNVGINPLLAKIEQTSSDVWGKEIIKLVPFGINGGIGAGTEIGELPSASGNNYAQFRTNLKNLYGTIEISDKAVAASQHSAGAFVNLLNAEMEGLLSASKFNLGRMLYGNGDGVVGTITKVVSETQYQMASVKSLMEGMKIDFIDHSSMSKYSKMAGRKIVAIDRATKTITIDAGAVDTVKPSDVITIQNSKDNEITGLGAIFSKKDLYGLKRANCPWLNPYEIKGAPDVTSTAIQEAIDYVDEVAGSNVDFIVTSYDVKRKYLEYLNASRTNIDYMNLDGGYKALSYCGIPVVSDRFVEDKTMYILNTKDFKLHQLSDWRWIEGEGGKVIKQKPGTPCYTATLVKYADLICDKPIGQAKITFA